MDPARKRDRLLSIYDEFERQAAPWKQEALCGPGCSFCCTHFGNVDVTTLEAVAIRDFMASLPDAERTSLQAQIALNRESKLSNRPAPCPFLADDQICRIYPIRPFSCRQLYSVKPCAVTGPTVHRGARELVQATIRKLQELDDTGYSGHMSFVLTLLEYPGFLNLYHSGAFNPASVAELGRKYRLVINRMMTRAPKMS